MNRMKMTKGKRTVRRIRAAAALILCLSMLLGSTAFAAGSSNGTGIPITITATGSYSNWEGVSNVAQFKGPNGNLCFAVDNGASVVVYLTNSDNTIAGAVTLAKMHPLFGTAIADSAGYYYLVTGQVNQSSDTSVQTIFISKYDSNGTHIATVGDNGSASLADYFGTSYCTKSPFDAGGCDAAINGNILTVHYGREMYSGHQSNSVFTVNTSTMSKVNLGVFYESHSFAQRVVATPQGFAYMSEGDCFDRSFTSYSVNLSGNGVSQTKEGNVFDFWVQDGAYDSYNMFVVNNNFAHMGGLAALSDGRVAFVAQSAPSLNAAAKTEGEDVFIQIYNPNADLRSAAAYTTVGVRSGLAGNNGRTSVTNYGVKWLTTFGNAAKVSNVQIASTPNDGIVVLMESSVGGQYAGVFYMVLDANGNVLLPLTQFSANARLNPYRMPVYANGAIRWVANRYGDYTGQLYVYSLSFG